MNKKVFKLKYINKFWNLKKIKREKEKRPKKKEKQKKNFLGHVVPTSLSLRQLGGDIYIFLNIYEKKGEKKKKASKEKREKKG